MVTASSTGDRRRWNDAELLAAIARRDEFAFSVFYRRYLSAVLSFLLRETGEPELAADLAAEVFAAVLLAADRYQPEGATAMAWVIGIARNKLRMSFRRGRVEARARKALGLEPLALHDQDLEAIEAIADAAAGRVGALVSELPVDEQRAVRARVIDERGYREIAAELECSELVVRKRVSRGLARLRDRLGGGEP